MSGGTHPSHAEMIADAIVHLLGILVAVCAGVVLLTVSLKRIAPGEYLSVVVYVTSLVTVMSVSCAYNLWPASATKSILRRFDHAAIYLLIAATYTPFLMQMDQPAAMIVLVWSGAGAGIALKLALPGRFDRLAVVFYLVLGWSGATMLEGLRASLSDLTMWLIVAGGLVYSAGLVFFMWKALRFQSAVWHIFVVVGSGLHLAAVADCLVLDRLQ